MRSREELSRAAQRLFSQEVVLSEHPFDLVVREVERALIEGALDISAGNQLSASHLLGIARTTLCRKIEEYGIRAR